MSDEQPRQSPPERRPPPFDVVKSAFYLVALVICVHLFIAVVGGLACIWRDLIDHVPGEGGQQCTGEKLLEILSAALAAALAFAGGKMRGNGNGK